MKLWDKEPALIIGAVTALVALGVSFGLPVTTEQSGMIIAAVTKVLALVTRHQVTPVTSPPV